MCASTRLRDTHFIFLYLLTNHNRSILFAIYGACFPFSFLLETFDGDSAGTCQIDAVESISFVFTQSTAENGKGAKPLLYSMKYFCPKPKASFLRSSGSTSCLIEWYSCHRAPRELWFNIFSGFSFLDMKLCFLWLPNEKVHHLSKQGDLSFR